MAEIRQMAGIEKYKSTLAFTDLLFNILLGVFILYWLALLLINDPESKQIDTVAQALVVLEWPDESGNDIDLWIRDPNGVAVGYQNRDAGNMSLERDDLGHSNDIVILGGRAVQLKRNHEVITLRGFSPGEYQISVHYYRHSGSTSGGVPEKGGNITPITVRLIMVNPKYTLVFEKDGKLLQQGDEMAIFQFTIETEDGITGDVTSIGEEDKHFVLKQKFSGVGNERYDEEDETP
jgi:hypothetical protein